MWEKMIAERKSEIKKGYATECNIPFWLKNKVNVNF